MLYILDIPLYDELIRTVYSEIRVQSYSYPPAARGSDSGRSTAHWALGYTGCVWIDLYYSYGPYTRRQDY
jgi:hypothetical protein